MSTKPKSRTKNNLKKTQVFSKPGLIVFALVFAAIGGYAIYRSFAAGGGLAPSVFVAQSSAGSGNGSSCANARPASYFNTSSNWGSGQAFAPDSIIGLCGNFTSDLNVLGNGTSGHPITIEPAPGQTVNAQAIVLGDGQEINAASYITVNGFHSLVTTGVEVDYRGFAGDPVPSFDTVENLHITNMSSTGGGMMHVWDGSNITITGNEIGPGCCNADAVDIAIRNDGDPNNNNITFTDNNVHDVYDTCSEVPTRFSSGCSGTGFGDPAGSGQQHIDGMQVYGANTIDIERNIFNLQGNERQGIFMQPANGGSFSNITLANNMISTTTDNTVSMSGPGNNSFSGYAKILYNTIAGSTYIYNGVFQAGTPITIAGNIFGSTTGNQSNGGCSMTYGDGSTLAPTWHNNLFVSQGGCDASDHGNATVSFVQAAFPGAGNCSNDDGSGCKNATGDPNFDLSTGSQTAVNGGESTYCGPGKIISADVHGNSRPSGSACDIGADEFGGTGGGTGGDTTPPTVSLTAPTSGTTVSGSSVPLSATASDNVAIASVQFKLDGANLGPADTTSPYSTSWNSTTATNGSHSLSALATDTSGNSTTSSSVTVTVSNAVSNCSQSSTSWQNTAITAQSTNFNLSFDTTPGSNDMDGVTGVSSGPATDYSSLAAIVRFNPSGFIDAINGAAYASSASLPYTAGTTYHVTLAINVPSKTYSILVTPQGGSQITLGTNYAFRTEQSGVTSLSNWATFEEAGSHSVCNLSLSAGSTPLPGDVNSDGHVNATDLSILLSNWNTSTSSCDFNIDGKVNILDLSVLLGHYGS